MTRKPMGIIDPWRTVEPVRPPEPSQTPRPDRIDLEDIDLDADLAIPGRHVIRSAHASFDVVSVRVNTPKDALDALVDCIVDAARVRPVAAALVAAGIGARCGNRKWNVPSEGTPASMLQSGDTALWFVQKPLDQGMLILARILRTPEVASACKRHGITVMT